MTSIARLQVRAVALLLLAFATSAAAADNLKPGEQLPWCRVTVNLAGPDKPPVYVTSDGWWDAETFLLVSVDAANKPDPFCSPFTPDSVVKVQKGSFNPQPMPALAVNVVNDTRKRVADAKKEKR